MNRYLLLPLALLVLSFLPASVDAATTVDVIITAHGYIVGSPSGLVISYTGEDYVDINWAKGVGADNTMIRVGTTGYPTSLTDGGLVYYGNGTSTQYVVNYARLLTGQEYDGLYFTAWSQRADGIWQMIGATSGDYAFWQDVNLMFVIVCLIVLTLTFFAFRLKNVALSIVSAFGWAGLGIHQLNLYYTLASISGVEPLIGYTCAVICIAMFIAPIMFTRKPKVAMVYSNVGVMDEVLNDYDMKGLMKARQEMGKARRR